MTQEQSEESGRTEAADNLKQMFRDAFAGYKGGEKMPLAGYAGLMGVFGVLSVGLLLAAKNSRSGASRRASATDMLPDVLLGGVATYKLSSIIAKDRVTSPLRAPFTEYERPAGTSEVKEHVRGTGARRAIGDLLVCPYCLGPWVATALAYGFVRRPGAARLVSGVFAAVVVSDLLHHAEDQLKKNIEQG